jgi:hypothetical protein
MNPKFWKHREKHPRVEHQKWLRLEGELFNIHKYFIKLDTQAIARDQLYYSQIHN